MIIIDNNLLLYREFLPGSDNATVWLSSYEESADDPSPDPRTTKIPISKSYTTSINTDNYSINANGMTLRNAKIISKQMLERKSKIAKPRRKKIIPASIHDKENIMVTSINEQKTEMDMSIEKENVEEIKHDYNNDKRILENKDQNYNRFSPEICNKSIDLEISPITNLRDDENDILSAIKTEFSDLSIRSNEELKLLRKSDSPDFYTSYTLNKNDLDKIKEWKNDDPLNFSDFTLNNLSFHQGKLIQKFNLLHFVNKS